jgi:hypothetical protein
MTDPSTLVKPDPASGAKWVLTAATAIDSYGDIVAYGSLNNARGLVNSAHEALNFAHRAQALFS